MQTTCKSKLVDNNLQQHHHSLTITVLASKRKHSLKAISNITGHPTCTRNCIFIILLFCSSTFRCRSHSFCEIVNILNQCHDDLLSEAIYNEKIGFSSSVGRHSKIRSAWEELKVVHELLRCMLIITSVTKAFTTKGNKLPSAKSRFLKMDLIVPCD